MTLKVALPTLAILFGASCASTTTASPKAESSSAAIRAAEEVGATHDPRAALHLQLAKEQAENAKALTDDKPRAERLLMRAQIDAELALALARSESEKAEAQQAIQKVNALKLSVIH